ncbi:glycosyltransferase family 2 protein [Nocardia sp. BMG111209]|uniref:glycosyltransferase family 2 protein n=1 Tax=Nocardia sp. BMG111209 TaxID=1160137 RepID=UPI00036CC41A|nr:galactosyltransferase-related protein [Nocardia sp. BMG111209]
MKIAVVTVAAGRTHHLRNQLDTVARSTRIPDAHIVVAMGDREVAATVGHRATTVFLPAAPPLPLAAARNRGARTALDTGADLLIFLDVDCLPDPNMIDRYQRAAAVVGDTAALLCGPVTYLRPPPATGYDLEALDRSRDPHPARPSPPDHALCDGTDFDLFWSLSFAVTTETWCAIRGFDPGYRGYGAEDTDFAYRAAAVGARLVWVGGAHAYHQYHPVSDPPIEHLPDILVNARLFHRRWGVWPMRGWLHGFAAAGLIEYVGGETGWAAQ